jgi:uncharacterized SAM-binding protein YcdF (DUF218 family)
LLRVTVIAFAAMFVFQVLLASSPIPEKFVEWLSCDDMEIEKAPRYVVVLAHDIPTEAGLMCAYYAGLFSQDYTGITYVIAMPTDEDPESSSPGRIRDELVLRGAPASDIRFESKGLNTYQQAYFVREMLGEEGLDQPIAVVTSPTHCRRAVLCFRKLGFTDVVGRPAENMHTAVDLGPWVFFRYTFWSRLEWQATIARELTAMALYKLRGWI